jgi:hypothetical protein
MRCSSIRAHSGDLNAMADLVRVNNTQVSELQWRMGA